MPRSAVDTGGGVEDKRRKSKKREREAAPGSDAARRAVERTAGRAQERIYEQTTDNFRQLARANDMTPKEAALAIGKEANPLGDLNPMIDDFRKDYFEKYGKAAPSGDDPEELGLAIEAWSAKRNMNYWRDSIDIPIGPYTIPYMVSLPELANAAEADILRMVSQLFGNKYTAVALQTALIEDEDQREATWSALARIAQTPGVSTVNPLSNVSMFYDENGRPVNITPEERFELLGKALDDPAAIQKMSPAERYQVVQAARAALSRQEELVNGGLVGDIAQGKNVLMRENGWNVVLDKNERVSLENMLKFIEMKQNPDGSFDDTSGWTTDIDVRELGGDQFGIDLFRFPGGVPTFTFNEEWAKKNFDEHVAVMSFLKERYPNMLVKYGEEGIVGRAFSLIDRTTDDLSAPVGAALEDLKERIQQIGNDQGERAKMMAEARAIEDAINNGEIPQDEVAGAVARMLELEDHGSNDAGWGSYLERVRQRSDPAVFGTGFGDSVTSALQIYPGDAEYNLAHAFSSLVGQVIFDPTSWVAGGLAGVKLARSVAAGARVGHKLGIRQTVFDLLSVPAEELWATSRGRKALNVLHEVASQVDEDVLAARILRQGIAGDAETARELARAAKSGIDVLQQKAIQWTVGTGSKKNIERLARPHIDRASRALQLIDVEIPRQVRNLQAKARRIRNREVPQVEPQVHSITEPRTVLPDQNLSPEDMSPGSITGPDYDTLYHVGPVDQFDSFRENGVLARRSRYDTELEGADLPERVFVASSVERALELGGMQGKDYIVYRVKKSWADTYGWEAVPEKSFSGSYTLPSTIPPERLEYLAADGTWRSLVPEKGWDSSISIERIDGSDEVIVRGWHGTDQPILPVHVKGEEFKSSGFHFGSRNAARERLTFRGINPDRANVAVVGKDGVVLKYFANQKQAKDWIARTTRSIDNSPEEAQFLGPLSGLKDARIVPVKSTLAPIEVRGRFYGVDAPLGDADQHMISMVGEDNLRQLANGDNIGYFGPPTGQVQDLARQALSRGMDSIRDMLKHDGYDGVMYTNEAEDIGSTSGMLFEMTKLQRLDEDLVTTLDEIDRLKATRKELLTRKDQMLTEKFHWESVLRGADWESLSPMRSLPKPRSIKRLEVGKRPWFAAWDDALDLERALPYRVMMRMTPGSLASYLRKNKKVDEIAERFIQTFRRWGRDTGTGQYVWMETSSLPEGALADEAISRGYKHIDDFATFIGTPDDVIERWIANLSKASRGGSRPEVYKAFVEGYEEAISTAKRLPSAVKKDMGDMWPEFVSERMPGAVRKGNKAGARSEPTLWVPELDPNGRPLMSGVPVLEADMIRGFKLPSIGQMQDYVSSWRSMMRSWEKAGGGRGKAAGLYMNMSAGWRAFNAAWARFVLHGKMPSALPLRIQLEQQIRVEAMGFSSLLRHPVEYLKAVKGWDEFALFGDSPAYALGVIMRDYLDDPARKLARGGRTMVTLNDKEGAMKALAGRIKAYANSPSARVFLSKKSNKDALAELMGNEFYWRQFQPLWDDIIDKHKQLGGPLTSYDEIFKRVRTEMKQVIGKGEGAARILAAAKSGRMTIDGRKIGLKDAVVRNRTTGKVVTEDGNLFAEELTRMYDAGEWVPDIYEFPRHWGDYLPVDDAGKLKLLKQASDWMFQTFYSRPDIYFGRSPLYRQIARAEYDRLVKLGYSERRAKDAAEVFGARQTADVLFTIGANTSADHFVRAIAPFFPAWKELAQTWLVKIPSRMGGGGFGGWAAGTASLARNVDVWREFFVESGIIFQENGQWRVKMGFMAPVVRAVTGLNVDTVSTPFTSLGGILPLPGFNEGEEWYGGLMPKIGAPPARVLHELADRWGGAFEDLENGLTLFGGDQSLGPAAFDNLLESVGWTPPWQLGATRDMYEDMKTAAVVDALRIEFRDQAADQPKREDFKSAREFQKAHGAWVEGLVSEAERKSRRWYFLRGVSGMTLPFSLQYSTDAGSELSALREIIYGSDDPEVEAAFEGPLLEGFRLAHPGLESYLTGDTLRIVPEDPDSQGTYEEFREELEFGHRIRLTPEEWAVWNLGQQAYARHRSKLNDIFTRYGQTPQQWLMSDSETSQAFLDAEREWERYLHMTDQIAEDIELTNDRGDPTSFRKMWDIFKQETEDRYGEDAKVRTSLEQMKASEALEALEALSEHFTPEGYTDDSYIRVRGTLNDILEFRSKSKNPVFKATSWWWENVGIAYSNEKSEVWDQINATPTSQRAPLYRQLVEIETRYAKKKWTHPEWGEMPSPQEVFFARLSPKARRTQLMGWGKLPVEFLSQFQRQQLYGNETPKETKRLNELAARINKHEAELDRIVGVNAISYSSNEYEALRARTDRLNQEAAQELKALKDYQQWRRPAYIRIDDSGVVNHPYWTDIVGRVQAGAATLEAQDVSPRGSTTEAVAYQRTIVGLLTTYRKKDERFDALMKQLEVAYGENADRPAVGIDLYWALFFDGFGNAPGYLNY